MGKVIEFKQPPKTPDRLRRLAKILDESYQEMDEQYKQLENIENLVARIEHAYNLLILDYAKELGGTEHIPEEHLGYCSMMMILDKDGKIRIMSEEELRDLLT